MAYDAFRRAEQAEAEAVLAAADESDIGVGIGMGLGQAAPSGGVAGMATSVGASGPSSSADPFELASLARLRNLVIEENACQWLRRDAARSRGMMRQLLGSGTGGVEPMWKLFPCFEEQGEEEGEDGGEAGSAGQDASSSTAAASSFAQAGVSTAATAATASRSMTPFTNKLRDLKIYGGELVELHGRSNCGKTEMLYAAVLHVAMPKSVDVSSELDLSTPLYLGGSDSGCLVFNFDYRFKMKRLETLLQHRIRRAYIKRLKKDFMSNRREQPPQQQGDPMQQRDRGGVDPAEEASLDDILSNAETRLLSFFSSRLYIRLREHLLANIFIFHANFPRTALAALRDAEQVIKEWNGVAEATRRGVQPTPAIYGRQSRKSWIQKEWEYREEMKRRERQQEQQMGMMMERSEEEEKNDMRAAFNAATASSSTSTGNGSNPAPSFPTPRIALICIDNIAAFHSIVRVQPPGYAHMAIGLNSRIRQQVAGGVEPNATAATGMGGSGGGSGVGSTSAADQVSWFYQLFSRKLNTLMQQHQLIAIATKPALSFKQGQEIEQSFIHREDLGLSWNQLVQYRLIIREIPDQAQIMPPTAYKPMTAGSHDRLAYDHQFRLYAEYGALRQACLKDIRAAAAASTGGFHAGTGAGMMTFNFRIGECGIKPETLA